MTLVMKPFGWIVAILDGILGGICLQGAITSSPSTPGLIGCLVIWCIGTYQIFKLNTEEVPNEIPTKTP
jgi:hypothetical protein